MPIFDVNIPSQTLEQILTANGSTGGLDIKSPDGLKKVRVTNSSVIAQSSNAGGTNNGIVTIEEGAVAVDVSDSLAGDSSSISVVPTEIGINSTGPINLNGVSVKKNGDEIATIPYVDGLIAGLSSSNISDWLTAFKPVWNPARQVSVSSVTGNTNENIVSMDSTQNLVGKIISGDVLSIMFGMQATNSGNNKTFRIYISDSPTSLSNQVLIGTATGTSNMVNTVEGVKYMNMTSISTQNVIAGTAVGGPQTGTNMGTTSIDFSSGSKYIVVTIQLTVGTETAKLQWLRSQINR